VGDASGHASSRTTVDRHRADGPRACYKGAAVRAHVPVHLRRDHRGARSIEIRRRRAPPSSRSCARHAGRVLGRRSAAAAPRRTPRCSHDRSLADDLQGNEYFGGGKGRRETITWLAEPDRGERTYTVISVDDDMSSSRPTGSPDGSRRKYAEEEPRVVPTDDGGEAWMWQGQVLPNVGFNAVVGRPSTEYGFRATRFDEMRRGAWDVDARVADMDIDGVAASLCFPSFLPGFVGSASHAVADRRGARAHRDARLQRLAPRRVVRRASRPLHPEPDRVPT